jgi:glutathione S-transferase
MADIKLSYFDFPGGRGEDCRLALFMAGLDFDDDRVKGADWGERKPATPFGAMPVLTVAGKGALAQSNAILRFIGSRHGLHPSDAWEAARHDAILAACEDVRAEVGPTLRMKDEAQKKEAREKLASGYLQQWGACVEKQIEGPFVSGSELKVADLKLFVLMQWFAKGVVDHVPTDVFKAFPKLTALHQAVQNHSKVQQWYARG